MQNVTVPLDRNKVILLSAACAFFVLGGLWALSASSSDMPGPFKHIPFLVHAIGLLAIVSGGAAGTSLVRMLLESSPGLTFDEQGLTNKSGILGAGFIPWNNISGFETHEISNQKLLYVLLKDPDQCLMKIHPLKRFFMAQISKSGPSPVAINPTCLNVGFDDLAAMSQDCFTKMKR